MPQLLGESRYEIGRSSVKIGPKQAQQIREYAMAVSEDARFADSDVRWEFIVVSTELAGTVVKEVAQTDRVPGVLYEDEKVRVRALTWGSILEDAQHRLKYVRERLGYDPTTQQAFQYLRDKHRDFLPQDVVDLSDEDGDEVRRKRADAA